MEEWRFSSLNFGPSIRCRRVVNFTPHVSLGHEARSLSSGNRTSAVQHVSCCYPTEPHHLHLRFVLRRGRYGRPYTTCLEERTGSSTNGPLHRTLSYGHTRMCSPCTGREVRQDTDRHAKKSPHSSSQLPWRTKGTEMALQSHLMGVAGNWDYCGAVKLGSNWGLCALTLWLALHVV
jgi:hypothetical protein